MSSFRGRKTCTITRSFVTIQAFFYIAISGGRIEKFVGIPRQGAWLDPWNPLLISYEIHSRK
jgi:hypothetical protein